MVEKVTISGGLSRSELILAIEKAELMMVDKNLYTGDQKEDKLTKTKIALMLANQR